MSRRFVLYLRCLKVLPPTQADWTPLGECWISWWGPLTFHGSGRSRAAWVRSWMVATPWVDRCQSGDWLWSTSPPWSFFSMSILSVVSWLVLWGKENLFDPIWDDPWWSPLAKLLWGETISLRMFPCFSANLDVNSASPELCCMVLVHDT